MTITDPYEALQALAPQVPDDEVAAAHALWAERSGGRHHPRRWLLAAAAVAAGTTAVVLWPASGESAFASWTPVPSAATPAAVQAAQTVCDAVTARAIQLPPTLPAGVTIPDAPPSAAALAGRSTLLAEQRGDFTFVLSGNGAWAVGCLTGPTPALTEVTTVDLTRSPVPPDAGGVDVLDVSDEGGAAGTPTVALVAGRAGAEVDGVDVTAADGTVTHATVADGHWSAWWPSQRARQWWLDAHVLVHRTDGTTADVGTVSELDAQH